MPVLIDQNLLESCIFLNDNHACLRKKLLYPNIHKFPNFLLSFDLSLSCKLQLIDLIMVSAASLAGRQTILVCFFRELWVRRKRKETNLWKTENATGCFLVQTHPSHFVNKVVCPVPKITIEECFFLHLFHIGWPCKHYNFLDVHS